MRELLLAARRRAAAQRRLEVRARLRHLHPAACPKLPLSEPGRKGRLEAVRPPLNQSGAVGYLRATAPCGRGAVQVQSTV